MIDLGSLTLMEVRRREIEITKSNDSEIMLDSTFILSQLMRLTSTEAAFAREMLRLGWALREMNEPKPLL